jgi:hypothetical protein
MRQALELALKFVEDSECGTADLEAHIKEALAQPERDYERGFIDGMQKQMQSSVDKAVNRMAQPEQEPVEWGVDWGKDGNSVSIIKRLADGNIEVLAWEYAPHPPQRTWVGLTDEEIAEMWLEILGSTPPSGIHEAGLQPWRFSQAIEAKLKEKNT